MKKTLILIVILLICLSIAISVSGIYFVYKVPIESQILVITELHSDSGIVDTLKEKLNGNYVNIYDLDGFTFYLVDINAPLIDIIKSDELLNEPNIVNIIYEWEFKTKSSLLYEM